MEQEVATEANKGIVAIDGASGYLGSNLVAMLCQHGFMVRAIVHENACKPDTEFLESCGAELLKANLSSNNEELKNALADADAVVHLIGSIAPRKGEKLSQLHAGQMQELLSCLAGNMKAKIILVSALGSSESANNEYHRTKCQSEELLAKSKHPYLILKPSLIVGRGKGRRDSKLMARYIKLIETRPRVPLINDGANRLQPVFVEDLCRVILRAIEDPHIQGASCELGGAEVVSMKELLFELMAVLSCKKGSLTIPFFAASALAHVLEILQDRPLLSKEQVALSRVDNICQNNAIESVFGVKPLPLKEALFTYASTKTNADSAEKSACAAGNSEPKRGS